MRRIANELIILSVDESRGELLKDGRQALSFFIGMMTVASRVAPLVCQLWVPSSSIVGNGF